MIQHMRAKSTRLDYYCRVLCTVHVYVHVHVLACCTFTYALPQLCSSWNNYHHVWDQSTNSHQTSYIVGLLYTVHVHACTRTYYVLFITCIGQWMEWCADMTSDLESFVQTLSVVRILFKLTFYLSCSSQYIHDTVHCNNNIVLLNVDSYHYFHRASD